MDERNPYAPPGADPAPSGAVAKGGAGLSPRAVQVGRGVRWVVDGLGLIKRGPLTLLALSLAAEVPVALLTRVAATAPPETAGIVSVGTGAVNHLLAVPISALYMLVYEGLDEDRSPRLARVAATFRKRARSILALSGIYLATAELLVAVSTWVQSLVLPAPGSLPLGEHALRENLLRMALGVAQATGLALAFLLAPALVVLRRAKTSRAIKRNVEAFFKNLGPLIVSMLLGGLVMLAIVVPATMASFFVLGPLAFGQLLLPLSIVVSTPIKAATTYCFYRDVFGVDYEQSR
jgi:hypothetical protein